jgi:exodeoxyribonuclease VII large subunit
MASESVQSLLKAAAPTGDAAPASNVPELTVGELSGALKRTIEDRFGFVRVRGEISNYRGPHASGHAYFCLKDDAARIDAVVWKTAFARLKVKPQEGLEVVATGRVTTFPGKSTYQIVIEAIEPAGVGALMALLEARRKALAAEGLFDEARRSPLPFLPRTIGVVTSPTGAVIRDILHRLADRFPRDVLVWPVRVQGETAAAEVAAAITGFNALAEGGKIGRPDLLIVARGGGSLEDLWAFNEEIVVRAAAASAIPLIAAVGHETDWTLIDHVADLRAPTPSGAAEKAVPVRLDLLAQQADLARRRRAAMLRLLERRSADLRGLGRALPTAESVTAVPRQRVDRAEARLVGAVASASDRRHLDLARLAQRLSQQAPRVKLAQTRQALDAIEQRMVFCVARGTERRAMRIEQNARRLAQAATGVSREIARHRERRDRFAGTLARVWLAGMKERRDRLAGHEKLLKTLGYKQVLARGFAIVRDESGHMVRSAKDAVDNLLDIEFADGHIEVTPARGIARKTRAKPKAEQGTLF